MKKIAILAAVTALLTYGTAFAVVTPIEGPSLAILWDDGNGGNGEVVIGADILGQYSYQNGTRTEVNIDAAECQAILSQLQVGESLNLQSLAFVYDQDPYVSGGLSVYNPSGVTQIYTFIFTSPVAPPLTPTSLYGGSMSGSMTAGLSVPATVATVANTPLYWGIIDGTPVLPIYSDPTSWTVPTPFGSGSIPAVTVPTTNVGPPVLTDISLQFKFSLTSQDITTMNGIFEVIPEPATLALLGWGSLLLLKRRV